MKTGFKAGSETGAAIALNPVHWTATDRRLLSAELDAIAAILAECYEDLSPKAKAKSIELATLMAELKKKL